MGASVVVVLDAEPVFEFTKHVLDFVAAFLERFVEWNFSFAVGFWWYADFNAVRLEPWAKPDGIASFVAQVHPTQSFNLSRDCALIKAYKRYWNQILYVSIAQGLLTPSRGRFV